MFSKSVAFSIKSLLLAAGALAIAACGGSTRPSTSPTAVSNAKPDALPWTHPAPISGINPFLRPDPVHHTVWADEGPRTWTIRTTVPEITANDLRTRLYQLADDSMMGRKVGQLGNVMGTAYIAAEFKKMGLEPGGDGDTSFFQTVRFGPHYFDSTRISLSVAGAALKWKTDWSPVAPTISFGPAFLGTNVPVMFGGRWGDGTPFDSVKTHGMVLVFTEGVGGSGTCPASATGVFPANVDCRPRSVDAAAVLVLGLEKVDPSTLAAPFAASTRSILRSAIPGGGAFITEAVAQRIFGKPTSQLKVGDVGSPISGAWDYAYHAPPFPVRNVIAIRRGSDPVLKNEYVVISAHNDHIGMVPAVNPPEHDSLRAYNLVLKPQGANDRVREDTVTDAQWKQINDMIKIARTIRPARRDTVMNGADDDGSGTAVLMEIAENYARNPAPKRSIIFVSHTGEEAGMYGSLTFTDFPTVPRDKIIGAFNMDMLGKGRADEVNLGGPNSVQILGSRRLAMKFGDMIDSVNANRSEPMAIDYTWEMYNRLNRFCRSDQTSYYRYNIPVAYLSLGYAIDYHMPTDEPQYIDYEHSARLARFVHDVTQAVANRNDRFVLDGKKQNRFQACVAGG